MTKISIVMPVFNSEKYLANCLESIMAQTFKDFELICVNDGSTDNSLNILNNFKKKYENSIKIINQNNQGAGASRNNGFKAVKSETCIFLDSDDYFECDFLEKMYEKYSETKADIVICRYNVILPDNKFHAVCQGIKENMIPEKEIFSKDDIPQYIFNFTNKAPWNKLYRTEFIRKNDLKFDNIKHSNDVFFTLSSLYIAQKIALVKNNLVTYRFLHNGATTLQRSKTPEIFTFEIFNKLKKYIVQNGNLTKNIEKSYYNAYLDCIMYHLGFIKKNERKTFLKKIKENVPLMQLEDTYIPYIYYRLLMIKTLPIPLYILLFKVKCIIKNIIFFNAK